jgi:hypothetical protein
VVMGYVSMVDPHWFPCRPDPDPAFNLNADPDPGSQTNADQVPDPDQNFISQTIEFAKNILYVGRS